MFQPHFQKKLSKWTNVFSWPSYLHYLETDEKVSHFSVHLWNINSYSSEVISYKWNTVIFICSYLGACESEYIPLFNSVNNYVSRTQLQSFMDHILFPRIWSCTVRSWTCKRLELPVLAPVVLFCILEVHWLKVDPCAIQFHSLSG